MSKAADPVAGGSRLEHVNIEQAQGRLNLRTENWLRKCGWKYTSSTPGCYWMWLKEWDGKTFMVDTKTAVRIQSIWDSEADYKAHPEEYED